MKRLTQFGTLQAQRRRLAVVAVLSFAPQLVQHSQGAIEAGGPSSPANPVQAGLEDASSKAAADSHVVAVASEPPNRDQRLKILKENLESLATQIGSMKSLVREKSRAYLELSQAQARPLYMWQDENSLESKKNFLLKIASLDLKQLVKKIETFQSRREEIAFELEWLGMDLQKEIPLSESTSPRSKKTLISPVRKVTFACNTLPVEALDGETAQIVQGFGETRDPESGIKWQSSGWWVQRLKADVHACAPGKVAFSGKIPGRGSVVLVDHGQGVISLYANLLDDDLPQRGTKVDSGTRLGSLKDKFYFEIRRDGQAVDPKSTFAPERLAKFTGEH